MTTMIEEQEEFSGEIVVASRIVDYLSSGLYNSPAACLKELVNNSYDADATVVSLFVQPDADRIIIADDGHGMNRADFERNFRRIAETTKRQGSQLTAGKRPKIGKIGIGFIAANEICDIMEIESTKKGSRERINVRINFGKMREALEDRRRDSSDLAKGDYEGTVSKAPRNEHYTTIFLRDVRGEARSMLVGETREVGAGQSWPTLYGLSQESIVGFLGGDVELQSWSDLDPYSETMLAVALNVPVAYFDEWLPKRLQRQVTDIAREVDKLDFRLEYDGVPMRKPIVFRPPDGQAFIERFEYEGENVAARGYFYVQHGVVRPEDLNGLLVRIRHAAVGEYDKSFMGFPTSIGTLFQRWISAEIWADDRLEDAMNIDRRTLRESHPAYAELQGAVHHATDLVIKKARKILYQQQNVERQNQRVEQAVSSIVQLTREQPTLKPSAAEEIVRRVQQVEATPESRRRLLKKYSVGEVYEVAIAVAAEVLEPADAERFVKALAMRLTGRR